VPAPKGEEDWLTGRFRPDFEHEAIATAALIKLCASYTQDHGLRQSLPFRAILTATPFGGGFQARTQGQQVITIIMARLHEAREAQAPHVLLPFAPDERQEFVYTDDIAAAALYVLHMDDNLFASATAPARRFLNAGYGRAVSYGALAMTLAGIVGYRGTIGFSPSEHPTQQTTHWLDSHRLRDLGWRPLLDMEDALALTYLHHRATLKATDTAGAANPKAV
jgi:nucleoside-diphosphate-sugar epimerase